MRVSRAFTRYMSLPQGKPVMAEYIWIGGSGADLRSKTTTIMNKPKSVNDLPDWAFDGSSTGQAPGHDSEVLIRPRKFIPDPIRGGDNILVLCDCRNPTTDEPLPSNKRALAEQVFSDKKVNDEEPWFGLEQEYTMFDGKTRHPLGWPDLGYPEPQGPYYCAVGTNKVYGRDIVEAHYRACMYAGLDISGINAEVMPGQWEFQIGPATGVDASDQLWLARYLLHRIAEDFGVEISFEPKPMTGDWNGAGCHCNFSTKSMRSEGGLKVIKEAMTKLEAKHMEHMDVYGSDNRKRMTGLHETSAYDRFDWAFGSRGVSIRVHRKAEKEGKGYFEDRRPAANCDPYLVTGKLAETCVLESKSKII